MYTCQYIVVPGTGLGKDRFRRGTNREKKVCKVEQVITVKGRGKGQVKYALFFVFLKDRGKRRRLEWKKVRRNKWWQKKDAQNLYIGRNCT